MKKAKKVVALALCAVMLVVGSVAGTMAYLTSKTAVATNTFSVGNVTITLDEAKVNADGQPLKGDVVVDKVEDADRQTSNTYKLMPGHSYLKDPVVHVDANSEDSWLFVRVTNDIAAIEEKDGSTEIAEQMKAKGWTVVSGTNNVYAYKDVVSKNQNIAVFDAFVIDDAVANDALAKYKDQTITVQAYAVQKDGFASAAEAWAKAPLADWTTTAPEGNVEA